VYALHLDLPTFTLHDGMADTATKLIIGIDFGTTFTAVSWVTTAGRQEVNIIDDWPNPYGLNKNDHQVPSTIAYDRTGRVSKWGYYVRAQDRDTVPFSWMKILLDPSHRYYREAPRIQEMIARLGQIGKTAEDIVSDFLKLVWDHTLATLRRLHEELELYTWQVVLTVPAVWSPAAKEKTLRAAIKAGMPAANIQLVPEPEAAALAVLKAKVEDNTVKIGDAFVICDAGGGTVDLISYIVENTQPLRMKECVMGDGGLCGSIFLDEEFERYIRTRVGREQYDRLSVRAKENMRIDFDRGLKRSFERGTRDNLRVELHGIADDEENDIDDETISIKYHTMMEIFNTICLKVQALVEKQLAAIQQKGLQAKMVVLVGGFGESKYLYHFLETANKVSYPNMRVMQHVGAILAVCRGATHWGLNQTRPANTRSFASRISRYSYGIAFCHPFDPDKHDEADKYFNDSKGEYYADGQMAWLLKRGDEVVDGRVLTSRTVAPVPANIDDGYGPDWYTWDTLLCSQAEPPPTRRADPAVRVLATATYSIPIKEIRKLPKYSTGLTEWYDVGYSRDILCGPARLQFRTIYNNQLIQATDVTYPDDSAEGESNASV